MIFQIAGVRITWVQLYYKVAQIIYDKLRQCLLKSGTDIAKWAIITQKTSKSL